MQVYKIAFASLRGLSMAIARELSERAPGVDLATFFTLDEKDLEHAFGIKTAIFGRSARRRALDEAQREIEWVSRHNVEVVYWGDERYPRRLLECDDAPLVLYMAGRTNLEVPTVMSIVGTRRATVYGTTMVERIVSELSEKLQAPPLIVSGLALGIDIAAHHAAINAGCPTVAVTATGLNTIYPAVHRNDAARIIEKGGMIVTEYRSIDAIHRGNFLARNRIIAGLADMTLVAESAEKGGAMTTARLASDYNRLVGAIPGRAGDRYSRGCNRLIAASRASLVQDADDIIALTGWKLRPPADDSPMQQTLFPELDENQQRIVDLLQQHGELHQNELTVLLGVPSHHLAASLMDLEFKRVIAMIPGGRYMLV